LAAIHAAGGLTMVLDPAHKPIGMQQNAIDFDGPINFIGNSSEIAAALENAIVRIESRPQIADASANELAREIKSKAICTCIFERKEADGWHRQMSSISRQAPPDRIQQSV